MTASAPDPRGGQGRAVDRVDGDIDGAAVAVADQLAVVEHRRFVLFALPDDHHAVERQRAEVGANPVDRRLVGGFLVATSLPPRCRHRSGLVTLARSSPRFRSGISAIDSHDQGVTLTSSSTQAHRADAATAFLESTDERDHEPAPVHPIGCPSATDPPRTLTLSAGRSSMRAEVIALRRRTPR